MKIMIPMAFLITALALAGCETMDSGTKKGAAIGAITGAAVGGIAGHQSGHGWEGAAIGAGAGAVGGGLMGRAMEKKGAPGQEGGPAVYLSPTQIVEMSKDGVPDEIITDEIDRTGSTYKMSSETIQYLKDNGVSDQVINYMLINRR